MLLGFKHLGAGDRAVGNLHKVLDRGGDGFFVCGCNEEAHEADELKLKSLEGETRRAERKRSVRLVHRKSVSGGRKHVWTWRKESASRTINMDKAER
jgi:hypothetical protein